MRENHPAWPHSSDPYLWIPIYALYYKKGLLLLSLALFACLLAWLQNKGNYRKRRRKNGTYRKIWRKNRIYMNTLPKKNPDNPFDPELTDPDCEPDLYPPLPVTPVKPDMVPVVAITTLPPPPAPPKSLIMYGVWFV